MRSLGTLLLTVGSLLAVGCGRSQIERAEWPVMGTVAAVQWRESCEVPDKESIRDVFAAVEGLLNAHDPESELSKLAKFDDDEVLLKCNPLVRPCYEAAFRMRDETGSAFNPRWRGRDTLDLGAIAKGFAVDLAAKAAKGKMLIDLGGNLKAVGGEWRVGIAGTDDSFVLGDGEACATSGEYFRGKHIFDGRTGAGIENSKLRSVTVIHPSSAMIADGLSTAMFVLGKSEGERYLSRFHPEAKVIWK